MSSIEITVPDTLREFVNAQVAAGGYASPSDYIHALLRDAQKRQAVEGLILDGLNSGEPFEVDKAYWDDKRRQLAERHTEAKRS